MLFLQQWCSAYQLDLRVMSARNINILLCLSTEVRKWHLKPGITSLESFLFVVLPSVCRCVGVHKLFLLCFLKALTQRRQKASSGPTLAYVCCPASLGENVETRLMWKRAFELAFAAFEEVLKVKYKIKVSGMGGTSSKWFNVQDCPLFLVTSTDHVPQNLLLFC